MVIGLLKETGSERRVAIVPEEVPQLLKLKVGKVLVQRGAGAGAFFADADYAAKGAEVVDENELLAKADILVCIQPLAEATLAKLRPKQAILGQMNPLANKELVEALKNAQVSAFSLDLIPRSTRAQAMDVLSSQATVAGYRAILLAATHLPTFFPMFMTAAGTIRPAKVLVLGAGVAGLQAIATARKLGAVVEAFDVRTAAKEEVLSLGAKFVEVEGAKDDKGAGGYAVEQSEEYKQRQAALVQEHAAKANVIICTAQIPGRRAPLLVTKEAVEKMLPGSVVVDMAASTGGNCAMTENDKTISTPNYVTIIGDSNLAAGLPADASRMFAKNVTNFLKLFIKDGQPNFDFSDDIIKGACVAHEGAVVSERLAGR
jgi:NAD(P) transhydrogenase subunit alpha